MVLLGSIQKDLENLITPETLTVCIGSSLKGDDGVGPFVCDILRKVVPERIIDAATVPENHIQPIINKNPDVLLIIDAIDFDSPAGTIQLFEHEQVHSVSVSTHTPSPRLFLDVIFQSIKPRVVFIGIQPGHVEFGMSLSQDVEDSAIMLANQIALCMVR